MQFWAVIGLLLMSFQPGLSAAPSLSLQWRIPSDSILIGEVLPATVEVTLSDTVPPDWQEILKGLGSWELISLDTMPVQPTGALYKHAALARVTTFDAGEFRLGPLILSQGIDTLYSNILNVKVYETQVDTAGDIRPIVPPMKAPLTWQELAVRIAIGIAALLVVILLWRWWKKWRKSRQKKEIPVLDKPARAWALEELQLLEAMLPASTAHDIKYFYDHLSYVMRVFMHYQYGIPALELTSAEIEKWIKGIAGYEGWSPEIMPVIKVADLAKFAKATPPAEHQLTAINKVKHWIQGVPEVPLIQP